MDIFNRKQTRWDKENVSRLDKKRLLSYTEKQ